MKRGAYIILSSLVVVMFGALGLCDHAAHAWPLGGPSVRQAFGGGCGPAFVTVTHQASPAHVDASTEGTIDWVSVNGQLNGQVAGSFSQNVRTKRTGGWLYATVGDAGTSAASTYGQTTTMTVSTTAADSLYNSAATNINGVAGMGAGATTNLGYGFNGRVPAACTTRVLRVYIQQLNTTSQFAAQLSVSGTTATSNFTVAGVETEQEFIVTYRGGALTDELVWSVIATTNTGSGNMQFQLATLGTS